MTARKPVNRRATGKRGGKTRTSWKPGQSGNPKGAPKRGEGWGELTRSMGDMEPAQVKEFVAAIGKRLPNIEGITLKQLAVLAAYVDAILDPGPGMFAALADRAEGKPTMTVGGDATRPIRILVEYVEGEAAEAALNTEGGEG